MRVTRRTRFLAVPAALVAGLYGASALSKDAPTEARTDISGTFEITPRVDWRFFNWRELGPGGGEHLKESGFLFAFGIDPRFALGPAKRFFVEAGINLYLGKVAYDGFLSDIPYKSKTSYFGWELLPSAGYVFALGQNFRLIPRSGIGLESWHRNLDDGGSFGYEEKYAVYFVHADLRGTYVLNCNIGVYSTVGLKVPVLISETVDLASRHQAPGNISLSPGTSPAFRIEGGSAIHGIDVAVYFETWKLTQSNVDKGFFQPESTRKIFGIRVGHSFAFN